MLVFKIVKTSDMYLPYTYVEPDLPCIRKDHIQCLDNETHVICV